MAIPITMPKLGLTMQEGTIKEWKKKEGEEVKKGEILYVLETEKVTFEVEAPSSGILGKIIAKVDDVVPVGGIIAYILQPGEKASDIPSTAAPPAAKVETAVPVPAAAAPIEKTVIPGDVRISPLARKIAEENNVNVSTIKGTGPEGRITKEDILRAIEEKKAAPARPAPKESAAAGAKVIPLSPMRKTIARRMSESFQTAPHFWVTDEADATDLKRLHKQLAPLIEKEAGVKLTLTDLLVKLVAKALKEHPNVNASWTEEGIKIPGEINIGIATDVPAGLIVPVIRDAGNKSLAQIAKTRADIVTRGREGKATIDDMTGGTFTLNNVGALGIRCINAIINPPQAAILTLGKIADRAVVVNGEITVRPMMDLSLGGDHRVLDGGASGRFLARVRELIESPAIMLL